MISGKNYQNSSKRKIFRFRDPERWPQKDFDPEAKFPPRYPDLDADEKLDVAEFIEFILANRDAVAADENLHFHMRDHANRPATTELEIPSDHPAKYSELNLKERQHVFEFISFLIKTR
jgi:hypothetical protein